jgi:hypothetical protein
MWVKNLWQGCLRGPARRWPQQPRRRNIRLALEQLEDRTVPSTVPVDVVGHLPAAEYNQFIANAVNYQGTPYKDWGNEPSVAVNPLNPNQIVVSTFAYGFPVQSGSNASLWYSTDGGADWGIRFPIAAQPAPGQFVPNDQVIAYDSNGVLHEAALTLSLSNGLPSGSPPALNVFHGTTTDPNADGVNGRPATVWQWNSSPANLYVKSIDHADQPWLALGNNHVYIGYGSWGVGGVQFRVTASADNGATFTADENLNSNGGLTVASNPGIRLATDRVGNVYSIFGWGEPPFPSSGQTTLLHYRLNMSSDGGQTWMYTKLGQKPGGLVIDDGQSLQLGSSFGGVNRLTGNITAIAADPTGAHVYAVYGKEDPTGTDRLYLAEFHPDGSGGLVERANPLPFSVAGQRSALPSIAVTDNGTIAVQYDTFTNADGQFRVHFAVSTDQGLTFTDQDLYDFTTTGIPYPLTGGNRLLGDYQDLIALGNSVYGTFAARGNVQDSTTGIDTTDKIDPFFYSVALPGGCLSSLAPSLGGGTTASTAAGATGAATTSGGAMGAAIPVAPEPAGAVWLGQEDLGAQPLQLPVAGVAQVIAAPDLEGAGRNSKLVGGTHKPVDGTNDGLAEDVLLDTAFPDTNGTSLFSRTE